MVNQTFRPTRRRALRVAAATTLATLGVPVRSQDDYPSRPVKLVLGFAPGGATDISARLLAQKMGQILGQQFVVENKPGASGNIAADLLAKSPPDGYTTMYTTITTHGINPSLFSKLPYDPVKDFQPVVRVGKTSLVLLVNNELPVRSLQELIALARKEPGKLAYGSAGIGNTFHLAMSIVAHRSGLEMVHVPYKGSAPALQGLMGNETQVMFDNYSSSQGLIKGGKLRALAVPQPNRIPVLPEVPTFAEAGMPGFTMHTWGGLVVPAATPRAIVMKLNDAANKALQSPEMRAQMLENASEPQGGTPEAFAAFIKSEMQLWGDAVRRSGASAN